jgi:hypothetical protein
VKKDTAAPVAGQQAVALSAERLKAQSDLPIEWDAQQLILSE